jgi:hypothetical protein
MWEMEIPPEGQNFGSGARLAESRTQNSEPRVEFPYPTSIQHEGLFFSNHYYKDIRI